MLGSNDDICKTHPILQIDIICDANIWLFKQCFIYLFYEVGSAKGKWIVKSHLRVSLNKIPPKKVSLKQIERMWKHMYLLRDN